MFDMTKIGKKISQTRKDKGLTQMELADKLGVTYQAVSNWERGATMPDISKLPELAQIFDITIEELLCDERKGKIVEDIAKGETPKDVQAEDLADVAPLLKQEQINKTFEQMNSDGAIDIQSIIQIAPFLDEDVLADIVKHNLKSGVAIKDIAELAPFMDEDGLGKIVKELTQGGVSARELAEIAPFLDENDLGEIVRKYLNDGASVKDISALAPFLDEADLGAIVEKLLSNGANISDVAELAPFMDEDDLADIAQEHLKNGGSFNDLMSVAPFLDMNELFRKYFKK